MKNLCYNNKMQLIHGYLFLLLLLFNAPIVQAATRTVYFGQTGRNTTTNGLGAAAAGSKCIITITNPSTLSQTIAWSVTATATGPGGAATANAATSDGLTGSQALAAGASKSLTYTYASYGSKSSGITTDVQTLVCSGNITATDSGTNPGFLNASGVLITFIEAGALTTNSATGAVPFGGQAVYMQIPIMINRGKSF